MLGRSTTNPYSQLTHSIESRMKAPSRPRRTTAMPRNARTADLMWLRLFRRFGDRADTLQGQLRDMIVQAVLDGLLQPGAALPSSRLLASRLGVSRTTVTLALDAMAQHGWLHSRARSGYFVGDDARSVAATAPRQRRCQSSMTAGRTASSTPHRRSATSKNPVTGNSSPIRSSTDSSTPRCSRSAIGAAACSNRCRRARSAAGRRTRSIATRMRWSSRCISACCLRAASGPNATRS